MTRSTNTMRAAVLAGALAALLVAIPAQARAATTIGSTLPSNPNAQILPGTLVQSKLTSGTLTSPIDGVIVRWRLRTGATAPDSPALRIAHLSAIGLWTSKGKSATANPDPNKVNVFATRLPIKAGDRLGLDATGANRVVSVSTAVGTDAIRFDPPLVDGGSPRSVSATHLGTELLVNADVEPDADKDGYGDESQDNCPQAANPSQANADGDARGDACDPDDDNDGAADGNDNCAARANADQADGDGDGKGDACDDPETSFAKDPKRKVKTRKRKGKVKFSFASSEPGSTFRCAIDEGPERECTSPFKKKLKLGKHRFEVVAVDADGNADPTPLEHGLKVKRKR